MADNVLTVQKYLCGKVRNITVPDDAVATIIMDAGVEPKEVERESDSSSSDSSSSSGTVLEPVTKDTDITLLTVRERELCVAWLYVWVASSPTQTGSTTDEDADWKHTEGGERMSAKDKEHYLDMANEIFEKYDLPPVGEENWGFVGRGIHNPRNYNPRR